MHPEIAARIFHDWAVREGFLTDPPTQAITSTPQEIGLITPKSEAGRELLRTKEVHAVASNEPLRCIIVFTRKATPKSKKQLEMLPKTVDDVEIVYRQGAAVSVGAPMIAPSGNPTFIVRQSPSGAVYACGSSISVGNYRDAGTLGCLVRNAAGEVFGLSNNHVSGSCNFAGVGLPILAPGVWDVAPNSLPPFTIGFHSRGLTLVSGTPDNVDWKSNTDAAIFKIHDLTKVTSFQGNAYDTPAEASAFVGNQLVEKVGRTTGHTTGRVVGLLHGAIPIPYAIPIHGFSGPVYFEPDFFIAGQGTIFSDLGDSGSLITTVDASGVRTTVGLVFGSMVDANAPGGKVTLALPIAPILQRFNVELVHGHNA